MAVMHEVAFLRIEVSVLRKVNKGLSKRRRAKKIRVRLGGLLTVQEAQDLLDQKAVGKQLAQEGRRNGGGTGGSCTKIQYCGVCGKPGHNARTCKEAAESSDSSVSNLIIEVSQYCGCVVEDSCGRVMEIDPLAQMIRSLITHVR